MYSKQQLQDMLWSQIPDWMGPLINDSVASKVLKKLLQNHYIFHTHEEIRDFFAGMTVFEFIENRIGYDWYKTVAEWEEACTKTIRKSYKVQVSEDQTLAAVELDYGSKQLTYKFEVTDANGAKIGLDLMGQVLVGEDFRL